jgi:hypothetical protein
MKFCFEYTTNLDMIFSYPGDVDADTAIPVTTTHLTIPTNPANSSNPVILMNPMNPVPPPDNYAVVPMIAPGTIIWTVFHLRCRYNSSDWYRLKALNPIMDSMLRSVTVMNNECRLQ